MKVFISCSGAPSRQVANLLKHWLKKVFEDSDPWTSNQDIDSGIEWFREIMIQLNEAHMGIICVTKENKDYPWLLFEAGALAKGPSSTRVIPFLINLEHDDLKPPLSFYNARTPVKESLRLLAKTINNELREKKISQEEFDKKFNKHWPSFEIEFASIAKKLPEIFTLEYKLTQSIRNNIRFAYHETRSFPTLETVEFSLSSNITTTLIRAFFSFLYRKELKEARADQKKGKLSLNPKFANE